MGLFKITLFVSVFVFCFMANSQDCPKRNMTSYSVDFCFTDSLYGDNILYFSQDASYFLFEGKKQKVREIKFSGGFNELDLIEIASNKKNKLSGVDVLLVEKGIMAWEVAKKRLGFQFFEGGLGIKILREGSGEFPKNGQPVDVHYEGVLENGEVFGSSYDRGRPFTFNLGMGSVIAGWDQGVAKLKKGSKAILWIPPSLGYGSRPVGPIPANSTLFFEIEVLEN